MSPQSTSLSLGFLTPPHMAMSLQHHRFLPFVSKPYDLHFHHLANLLQDERLGTHSRRPPGPPPTQSYYGRDGDFAKLLIGRTRLWICVRWLNNFPCSNVCRQPRDWRRMKGTSTWTAEVTMAIIARPLLHQPSGKHYLCSAFLSHCRPSSSDSHIAINDDRAIRQSEIQGGMDPLEASLRRACSW